jgi:hypothetical protein
MIAKFDFTSDLVSHPPVDQNPMSCASGSDSHPGRNQTSFAVVLQWRTRSMGTKPLKLSYFGH